MYTNTRHAVSFAFWYIPHHLSLTGSVFLLSSWNQFFIVDIRKFNEPLVTLKGRAGCFNGISWAPHSNHHIATAGDDNLASIWDIQQPPVNGFRAGMPVAVEEPILSYKAQSPITQIQWSTTQPEWIAICYDNILEILKWWEICCSWILLKLGSFRILVLLSVWIFCCCLPVCQCGMYVISLRNT